MSKTQESLFSFKCQKGLKGTFCNKSATLVFVLLDHIKSNFPGDACQHSFSKSELTLSSPLFKASLPLLKVALGHWPEPRSRTQVRMLRYYLKVRQLPDDRLTKKIYRYDQYFMQNNPNLQCFSSEIQQIVCRNNLLFSIDAVPPKLIGKKFRKCLVGKRYFIV